MGVDGVRRDLKIVGDGSFRVVIKYSAHDLKFLSGKF